MRASQAVFRPPIGDEESGRNSGSCVLMQTCRYIAGPSSLGGTQPHTLPPLKKVCPPPHPPGAPGRPPIPCSILPLASDLRSSNERLDGKAPCHVHAMPNREGRQGDQAPPSPSPNPPPPRGGRPAIPPALRFTQRPKRWDPQGGYHSLIVWRARSSARPSIHPLATAHCPLRAPKKEKSAASQPLDSHQQRKPRSCIGGRAPPPPPPLCTPYSFPPPWARQGDPRQGRRRRS